MSIKGLKGFKDILPGEVATWQRIEATARRVFERFGFAEIRVPILEKTELFARTIGEVTDIVEKEMYTFIDRNGDSITMRPEGTAPVLRAFIEHGLHVQQPVNRIYTIGPMFRHERPQKGRLRQFHQLSVEVLGAEQPGIDAELMAMACMVLTELGLSASLEINSLGCPVCRPAFKEQLVAFLAERAEALCPDCQRRRETNPLRVLDCKSQHCQEQYEQAPLIIDHLCPGCSDHFDEVRHKLGQLNIPYKVNGFMVRGLDYYSRTTFELLTDNLGAQAAVGAGGRYDGLVSQLGGQDLPGIGFALGMERLALLLEQQGGLAQPAGIDLFVAALGEKAAEYGFVLLHGLRLRGVKAVMDHAGRSLKSQMKQAARQQAGHTLLLGEEELASGQAQLRNMENGEQAAIPLAGEIEAVCATICKTINHSFTNN